MSVRAGGFFSIPNVLSAARILLLPFLAEAVLQLRCGRALLLVAAAGASDGLDGLLARRFGWRTAVGAYLDPVADKVLLTGLYVCLGWAGLVPMWLVWMVAARDLWIVAMSAYALLFTRIRSFSPSVWGKLSTFLQLLAAGAGVASCFGPIAALPALVAVAAAATVWSGVHYTWRAARMWRQEGR
ncbi:MAG: CDP-alcohol phosphatidyltransferase family protein [Acidobacteria bacterium]|nr:CDP-alcohol phosphatidyltransferase family protein [Acidobacteriota bacterium]MBI3278357.1 CDP-alcohol phosphatidyltransferase family protein [Acidobacteriota bacterium]